MFQLGALWLVARGIFLSGGAAIRIRSDGGDTSSSTGFELGGHLKLKVRFLWVRHAFSCANALDAALKDQDAVDEVFDEISPGLFEDMQAALQHPKIGFPNAQLDPDFGVKSGGTYPRVAAYPFFDDGDCTVQVNHFVDGKRNASRKEPTNSKEDIHPIRGSVVRVHDLYQDPLLTDCALYQSRVSGNVLLRHLLASGFTGDYAVQRVYSSMLLRAMETANEMIFWEGNSPLAAEVLSGEIRGVVAVPFMTEYHPVSGVALDNTPLPPNEQQEKLGTRYADKAIADTNSYSLGQAQIFDWSKFKAFLASALVPDILTDQVRPADLRGWLDMLAKNSTVEQLIRKLIEKEDSSPLKWGNGFSFKEGTRFDPEEYNGLADVREITVMLSGHSGTMMAVCGVPKPANNAVLQRLFIWEINNGEIMIREQDGMCQRVMDAPEVQSDFQHVVNIRDVKSCTSPFDIAPLISPMDVTASPDLTMCEKFASPDAYNLHDIRPEFVSDGRGVTVNGGRGTVAQLSRL